MSTKLRISAEAMALARDHAFAGDESFMLALTEALARLHHTATASDRVSALNMATAEHVNRIDAADLANTRAEAANAERSRIRAILAAPEAQGCTEYAMSLALRERDIAIYTPGGKAWGNRKRLFLSQPPEMSRFVQSKAPLLPGIVKVE